SQFPRAAIEAIGILLLIGFALVLHQNGRDLIAMLPVLGLLALGAQKLIPLLQQIYGGWSAVLSAQRSVDDVLTLLDFAPISAPSAEIRFAHQITLEGVSFAYEAQRHRP